MATRTITVNLAARATGLVAGFRSAQQAASGFATQTTAAARAAGSAMTAAGSTTGTAGRQMSTAMTQAQAAAQASRAALISAGEAAQELAKDMGMSYNASGQLVDEFGNIVTEAHAAELGLETASDATREFAAAQQHAAAAAAAAAEASATGMQRFGRFAQQNREAMEEVGKTATVMGGVLVAGFGKAVHTFASFDQAMSSVRAATHETEANMELLSEAAIAAGADTAYSAEESARAIEEMAKAGVSTADILNGGLNGALSLAAAGALDVGEAAETAASAMTQFKLKGSDIPHITDLLAAGAGKAQGSVHDLGMALNQTGLVASQTGLTIEEATGGLAAFASAGLIGSDAGTSFKTMLQRLNPQSEGAAALMADLGLSAYDAQGEFIGLSEYAGKLQAGLKDMSSEQRNAAMQTLFGSDAVRAAAVLYEQGSEGVQQWIDAVDDAGYAAETAAMMQDNLAGDLEKLGGALDTVFLKAGGTGNDGLRSLVQSAEDLVDTVGKIPAPVLGAVGAIAGIGGAALIAGGAFVTLAPRAFETVGHFRNLASTSPRVTNALGKLGKAAGIAAAAFVAFEIIKTVNNSMHPATASVEEFTQALIRLDKESGAIDSMFDGLENGDAKSLFVDINNIGDAMYKLENLGFNGSITKFGSEVLGVKNWVSTLTDSIEGVDDALANATQSGNLETATNGFRSVAESAKAQGISVEKTAESFPNYINALRDVANNAGVALDDQELLNWAMGETPAAMTAAAAASDETAAAIGEVGGEAEAAALSLEEIVEALFLLGTITMSSRDSTAAFHQAIRDMNDTAAAAAAGTLGLGAVLNQTATDFDLTTEAGAAANASFQALAQAGMTDVEAKAKEGMGQPELQANLKTTYDSLINAANGMGITGGNADALARKVLGVPDNVDINSWMSDAAKRMAETTGAAVSKLDGKTANVYVNTHETTFRDIVLGPDPNKGKPGAGTVLARGRAAGGPIIGPGTGTSDTAGLFALSNGEHVLTADEVRRMGGHKAVYDFRAQLKAGIPAYAGGGRVGREYSAPAAVAMPTSPASAVPSPTTFTGNLYLDSGEFLGRVRSASLDAVGTAIDSSLSRVQRGGVYAGRAL